ncbi:BnaC09g51140D [Brassica napus]|uniref:BnaC09g51140D protein n=2 Tax=Brassica TaxID=3705 RepID=A0A078JU58_BRANA|nr:BnaC09g51140D [Brassica napus]
MRGSSPSSSSPTSSSSSPATRRGKKNGSEKPKQPQRGLGVAQLEKIRLHSEMSCNSFDNYSSSFGDHRTCGDPFVFIAFFYRIYYRNPSFDSVSRELEMSDYG